LFFWDKALHFVAFSIGAMLLSVALLWSTRWHWKRIGCTAIVAIAFFGVTDEWHQRYNAAASRRGRRRLGH
jgi:hypothetical protein